MIGSAFLLRQNTLIFPTAGVALRFFYFPPKGGAMPYKVFQENGKHKVYKLGADNKKTGKPLGEHDGPGKAAAQVRALYANEKKPKKEAEPITYTVTSDSAVNMNVTQPGEAEATKEAETDETKCYGEGMAYAPIGGPTTFADLEAENAAREAAYEMHELTHNFQRLAANIMASPETEDKAAALTALASEYASLVSDKAKLDIDKEKAIAKQIAGDNQPDKTTKSTSHSTDQQPDTTDTPGGDSDQKNTMTDTQSLFIWKEGDVYRWLAAYSNNRRDSDNPPEIISTESHKEFDEALSKGEWPMPELWPWHVPFPVGVADYHAFDEGAGFPVAAGHFYKGMEWAAEGMIKAGWDGTSHGMPKDWIARDENDPTIIERHRTKEISPLPTWAAANKLAFTIISKETTMADQKGLPVHKRDEFIKAFGEERVTQIETALADKAKEADDAGIEKKEVTSDTGPALTRTELKGAFEVILEAINNLEAKTEARFKALEEGTAEKEESFDLVTMLKSKSAIGKAETKVDGRSSLAKDGPEEAQAPSASQQTVGVPVGLLDGLFQLNQGWYNDGKG